MRNILLLSLLVLLTGCANQNLLEISANDMGKLKPSSPINRSLTKVGFDRNKIEVCLPCKNNYDWKRVFGNYWEDLFDRTYPEFLKDVLNNAGIFDSHAQDSVLLKAKLVSFDQQSDFGSARIHLTVQYQLMNGNAVIYTWNIHSLGHANHFAGLDNLYESVDEAIAQNIHMFSLILVADTSPADRERIKKEIAALNKKMNTDNASVGNIFAIGVGGVAKSVQAVGDGFNNMAKSVSQACQQDPSICNGQQNQATIDSLNRGNQETERLLAQQRATNEQAKAMQASAQGGTSFYAPPPRQFTPGVAMGTEAGDNSASSDGGSTNASENRNTGSSAANGSSAQKMARCTDHQRFNSDVQDTSSERATERSYAAAVRQAQEWVSQTLRDATGSLHGKITDIKQIECLALGGNPLYRQCLIEVTYDYDCDSRSNGAHQ